MDHFWTYNAPPCPNAVQWSLDNQLAVACGHTACVLAPGHLDGPRASAASPTMASGTVVTSTDGLCVGAVPAQAQTSESLVWAVAGEIRARGDNQDNTSAMARTHVRGLAWSAPGCTPQAGCYLALLTTDNQVRVQGLLLPPFAAVAAALPSLMLSPHCCCHPQAVSTQL